MDKPEISPRAGEEPLCWPRRIGYFILLAIWLVTILVGVSKP